MAASSGRKDKRRLSRFSLAHSSSASSVEDEDFLNEYSEDFHSTSDTSNNESGTIFYSKQSENSVLSTSYSNDDMRIFIRKKIEVLKKNRPVQEPKSIASQEMYKDFSPLWLEKLRILKKKNQQIQHEKHSTEQKSDNILELAPKEFLKREQVKCSSKDTKGDSKSALNCFQTALERMKFENLRFKNQTFLNSDIHLPNECKECQEKQQKVTESEFDKRCLQTVQQKDFEEKIENYIQTKSSTMLIGRIIADGPKPSWSSEELWDKLLSGGFQHPKS